MKDITVFIIGNKSEKTAHYNGVLLKDSFTSIDNQLKSTSLEYEILNVDIENIPTNVRSNLVVFLDADSFIPGDYIFNLCSYNNIFRDTGIFFGPIITESKKESFIKAIKDNYHRYDLGIDNLIVCDITKEEQNHGPILGSVITGNCYNEIGFTPLKTPRGYTIENKYFIELVSKKYKILYCKNLFKLKSLNEKNLNHESISRYYYEKGYLEGVLLSIKNLNSKKNDIWHKFVYSPEILDYESPRWLFEEDKEKIGIEYLEFLVILKCQYQLGLFEGMLGKKII